ncbi:formimidoylglutamate deiminase [Aureimonas frigidaquae]|uniref:N-formimino-L-glutamate deiminase n=1 Tax=Aureimonas frigidaquae TaxID=424757 RepID=A0A0P0Z0Z4_9HYPH|nr:formimidoylglutamate deiminase [Aureimonas frigidaquae]BAT27533.1 N-formimino-L-glutamate deiminase [Aureimonas frigidaquae]
MLIRADTMLTPQGWRDDAIVVIGADGRIAGVEDAAGRRGDMNVPVLLPALSNLHSHSFQRAMAGLTEWRGPTGRDSFWTWRSLMYRFLDVLTPDDIEAIAAFAFMEMLESGFGAVAEFHYLHRAAGAVAYDDPAELSVRIAAAAATSGIGLTLLPVLYQTGGLDGRALAGGQQRFYNDLDGFARLMDGARQALAALPGDTMLGVAPHSLRAVPAGSLSELLALNPTGPFHIHAGEQEVEVAEVLEATGLRPIQLLLERYGVDERWCVIHATHMDAAETRGLAASGAVAGLCPVTEANLGDGIFNAVDYGSAGGRLGIGSDSNIRIATGEELRQLEYSQRLRHRERAVLARPGGSVARHLYDAALAGGAQALARNSGAVDTGRWADLVALDPARFSGRAEGDGLLDGFVFTGDSRAVTHVWSAGRHVVADGAHKGRAEIAARYRTVCARLDRLA